MCRAFVTTLRGSARLWARNLKPGSINSFAALSTSFASHFSSSGKYARTSASLMSLRQRQDESLKAFMRRFNGAALEVKNLETSMLQTALINALKPGPFLESVGKKPPTDMASLMEKVQKFINLEENLLIRGDREEKKRKPEVPRSSSAVKKGKELPSSRGSGRHHREDRRRPADLTFTPLSVPQARVLMEIKNKDYVRWLTPMQTPVNQRDRTKYCEFHRDHGHDCASAWRSF